jgi:hypothetical protein
MSIVMPEQVRIWTRLPVKEPTIPFEDLLKNLEIPETGFLPRASAGYIPRFKYVFRLNSSSRLSRINGENIAHVPYFLLSHIHDYVTYSAIGAHAMGFRSPNRVP